MTTSLHALRGITIGFIGAGKMGQALLQGLTKTGVSPARIYATDVNAAIRGTIARRFHVHVSNDPHDVARRASVIILAVKPQQMGTMLQELSPALASRHLVISIAAGITLRWLQARLPGIPVIRVMPNLPATVGKGFSAIAIGSRATKRHRAIAHEIFRGVGESMEMPERYFDAITAVSGSGPAYVFFLVQMWEDAARNLGLPSSVAILAIRQTLQGSVSLLDASQDSVRELIAKVASKGGTTEAALKVLQQRRVAASFQHALRAAAKRSQHLSA